MSPGRKLLYSALTFALVSCVLEASSRLIERVRPPERVDYGLGFDSESRVFDVDEQSPKLRITRASKRPFFRSQSFTARKEEGTLRIAAVGGSSVNFLHSELRILAEVALRAKPGRWRRAEVLNAGGLTYGTHRLVPVLAEVLELEPDLVLLYTGHNEFEEVEQLELARAGAADLESGIARHLALFRLMRDLVSSARIEVLQSEHNARILSELPPKARAWTHPFGPEEVDARMAAYERNLEIMADLAQAAGVPLVIGTVPSNLVRPLLGDDWSEAFQPALGLYRADRWEEGAALARKALQEAPGRHQASDAENAIIRGVAARRGLPLADVEARVTAAEPHGVPGETLFHDHCHLNRSGSRLWRLSYEPLVTAALN